MSGKISKSDTTPEMEREAEEWRQKRLTQICQHFAIGTWIMSNNRRGLIADIVEPGTLKVLWIDDGSASIVRPHALNRT